MALRTDFKQDALPRYLAFGGSIATPNHKPMTTHILILCTHNSARSALAEAMLNHWAQRLKIDVCAHSAGSAPSGRTHPFALQALAAAGVATQGLRSKSWDEFTAAGAPPMRVVITVCDNAANETCPFWPGSPVSMHWGYPDPSSAAGGDEAKRQAFELTRQAMGYRMLQLLQLPFAELSDAALQNELNAIGQR
jgi:arsenate reductase (thioredoxin)